LVWGVVGRSVILFFSSDSIAMEPPPPSTTRTAQPPKAKLEPPPPTSPLPTEEEILQELLQRGPSTANELRAALKPRYPEVRTAHINQHLYRLEKLLKVKRTDAASDPPRWISCAIERTSLDEVLDLAKAVGADCTVVHLPVQLRNVAI
jgi:DNA-binding HxlR family transcriptional regulator